MYQWSLAEMQELFVLQYFRSSYPHLQRYFIFPFPRLLVYIYLKKATLEIRNLLTPLTSGLPSVSANSKSHISIELLTWNKILGCRDSFFF